MDVRPRCWRLLRRPGLVSYVRCPPRARGIRGEIDVGRHAVDRVRPAVVLGPVLPERLHPQQPVALLARDVEHARRQRAA
jgi:hypothetical protein